MPRAEWRMSNPSDMPDPQPRQLRGESDPSEFQVVTNTGAPFDPRRAVVPIIKQAATGNYSMVGTGFFIAQNALVATAKHVITDAFDNHGRATHKIGITQLLEDNTGLMRPFVRGTNHDVADLSIALPMSATDNNAGLPLSNLALVVSKKIPRIGSKVFTYAYPKTTVKQGKPQKATLSAAFYAGELQEYLPEGRDRVFLPGPCYRTSMIIHDVAVRG
jgi:hypothetical protein